MIWFFWPTVAFAVERDLYGPATRIRRKALAVALDSQVIGLFGDRIVPLDLGAAGTYGKMVKGCAQIAVSCGRRGGQVTCTDGRSGRTISWKVCKRGKAGRMTFGDVTSKFTFIGDAGTNIEFDPRANSDKIRAIARLLGSKLPPGSKVGLLFKSTPELVSAWFASLLAGLKPLIIQYPTRKQSGIYWSESVRHTIGNVGLAGLIADAYCAQLLGDECGPEIISQSIMDDLEPAEAGQILPRRFDIIQLSSGTTGFRKAIQFSSEQLVRHVEDYNAALGLSQDDRIVSWLPLYHDMGYIACFVMPLLLGIDIVRIDPMTWAQNPCLLYEAINRYHGTICYMPNFGFELMSRLGRCELPTMRRWISCSEPVLEATSQKFLKLLSCGEDRFSVSYALAENVFAVTLARGCRSKAIDELAVVSCGTPIQGVDLKVVDGEIWVKSRTSIVSYADGSDIRDESGYYPTGDIGQIIDGEVFVFGRKQDLLIQGGRKFMLSDVDLRLNELFPEVRGRAATLGWQPFTPSGHIRRIGTSIRLGAFLASSRTSL